MRAVDKTSASALFLCCRLFLFPIYDNLCCYTHFCKLERSRATTAVKPLVSEGPADSLDNQAPGKSWCKVKRPGPVCCHNKHECTGVFLTTRPPLGSCLLCTLPSAQNGVIIAHMLTLLRPIQRCPSGIHPLVVHEQMLKSLEFFHRGQLENWIGETMSTFDVKQKLLKYSNEAFLHRDWKHET